MIDVPVEVKDALRDGRQLKNYRLVVLASNYYATQLNNYEAVYAPQSGLYRFYYPAGGFAYGIMIGIDGGGYWDADPTETEIKREFYIEEGARILAFTSSLDNGEPFMQMEVGEEEFTIDNDNLVSESVSIDERMVSGDVLKFGLCEGSSLEFQYFGYPNITGRQIKAFIDVEYGDSEPFSIPMGYFTVNKCSRQASTGIIKVTAYNKLMSEYLDAKANDLIMQEYADPTLPVTLFDIRNNLLQEYEMQEIEEKLYSMKTGGIYINSIKGIGFRFTEYTIQSPINPYQYVEHNVWPYPAMPTLSTTKYIAWDCMDCSFEVNPKETDLFRLVSDINFTDFETNLYNYIVKMIDDAYLSISGQQFINTLLAKGWSDYVFSVRLYKKVGDTTVIEKYSDLGMIYDTAHTTGSITDLLNRSFTGYNRASVVIPRYMSLDHNSSGTSGETAVFLYPTLEEQSYDYVSAFSSRSDYSVNRAYLSPLYTDAGKTKRYNALELFQLSIIQNESPADKILLVPSELPDVTLRDVISSSYETQCKYGQLDRETDLFSGVELNHSRLYPQETLYPDDGLLPDGAQSSANRSMYSKLWADEGNVHKWRNLIITYKGLDDQQQEKDLTYEVEINADGTDDYICSDNWIFKNLIWTEAQIEEYAEAMASKMQDVTWFPFEMWCAGLPYLETGDEIEIPMGENSYTSYVLQRQLKGIQNLQDTYINGNLDIF